MDPVQLRVALSAADPPNNEPREPSYHINGRRRFCWVSRSSVLKKHLDDAEAPRQGTAAGRRHRRRIAGLRALARHWREDFEANGREFMRPGFQAVAIYRYGVWADGIRNPALRKLAKLVYYPCFYVARNLYGIELPLSVEAGRRLRIGHQSGIVVHRSVRFGDDCLLRQNVTIGIARDDTPPEEAPVIGNRVQIGAGAVILSPARIGDDATIGPNVVVRETVPPGSLVLPPPPMVREPRPREAAAGGSRTG